MELMIGCPVYRRDWILPRWFEHVEQACEEVGVEPTYVFATDTRDEHTHALIQAFADMNDRMVVFKATHEDLERQEKRMWNSDRIRQMVDLRNHLLHTVRHYRPKHFLSLDSDILLSAPALAGMYELIGDHAAVGGKVYLSKAGTRCPSYATLRHGRMIRPTDIEYVKKVDVIMAVKMMNPCAYDIDYKYHYSGEDIGWCQAVKEAGLTLAFDGRYASKHVWEERFLDVYDRRVGF